MAKIMKLLDDKGQLAKTKGQNPRYVPSCFVKSYTAQGWVVVPDTIGNEANPEFVQPYLNSLKAPRQPGATFTGAPGAKPVEAEAAKPAPLQTAKDRQAAKE